MKLDRAVVLVACLTLAAGAFGQGSLLGKKKGGGSGGGSSNPPAQSGSSSGGSKSTGSSSGRQSSGNTGSQSSSSNSGWRSSKSSSNSVYVPQTQEKNLLQRTPISRSGRVSYGSTNNILEREQRWRNPQSAPSRDELNQRTSSMRNQIRREDRSRIRFDYDDGRVRVGYYHYDRNWRDDRFCYPYYVFNPYQVNTCVVSPWYYYPSLPAYINTTRIVYANGTEFSFIGFPYDYIPARRYDDRYDDRDRGYRGDYRDRNDNPSRKRYLDYAIDDITDAFERQDQRAVDRLVPRYGTVTVTIDGSITYGVNSNDFYDMLMDAVTSSKTISYRIESVKANDDQAEVIASHQYLDPWGQRMEVFHRFNLVGERGGVFIRGFATSNNPNW